MKPTLALQFEEMKLTFKGISQPGCGHFKKRMTEYPNVFRNATGVDLYPGTLNVRIDEHLTIEEDFRITGKDICEPNQDLLFERCVANGVSAFRIRPCNLATGHGGHGDNVLEIASDQKIPNSSHGSKVVVEFCRPNSANQGMEADA